MVTLVAGKVFTHKSAVHIHTFFIMIDLILQNLLRLFNAYLLPVHPAV
jgi:hypothetical protein